MESTSNMIHQNHRRRAMASFDAAMLGVNIDLSALPEETKVRLSVPCCECGEQRIFPANVHVDEDNPANSTFKFVTDGPCDTCREKAERDERLRDLRTDLVAMFPRHLTVNTIARLPAKQMAAVMNWKPTSDQPGLLLHGPTGGAKTRLAIMKATAMAEDKLARPCFMHARDFTHEVQYRFSGDYKAGSDDMFATSCHQGPGPRWIRGLCREWLLVFDDIGKGRVTPRVEMELYGLIDERFMNGRPTIITSNMDGDGLLKMFSDDYAEPLVRRLREYCLAVGFPKGCAK